MSAAISSRKIYCFDTSAFVTLSRTDENIIQIPGALWELLEKMMQNGEVISHKLVFEEISSNSKKPDFITKWVMDKERFFINRTQTQLDSIPKIVSNFPGLIDPLREHEQADIWLIALAVERAQDNPLFGGNTAIVVSQENPNSSKKIPAACNFLGIKHMSLREFFDEIGLGVELIKR